MRSKLSLVVLCVVFSLSLATVSLAQDDTGALGVGDITGASADYYGQQVTVQGNVNELVNVRSFLLGDGTSEILVLDASGQEFNIGLTTDAQVTVTGTIYPSFNEGGWDQVMAGLPMGGGMMQGDMAATMDPAMQQGDMATMDPAMQPTMDPAMQGDMAATMDPAMQPTMDPAMQGDMAATMDPAMQGDMAATMDPAMQGDMAATMDPAMQGDMAATMDPAMQGDMAATMDPAMQGGTGMEMGGMSTGIQPLDQYPQVLFTDRFGDYTILVINSPDAIQFVMDDQAQ